MTTEHSTYTYDFGTSETVTLKRGPATPPGHALLKINYSDGQIVDCYVNTTWLRDRLNDLDPRPLAPDAITDAAMRRAVQAWEETGELRPAIFAALTTPARPEGAEDIERLIRDAENEGQGADSEALANYLAARLTDPSRKED